MNKSYLNLVFGLLLISVPFMNVFASGGAHGNNHVALFGGVTKTSASTEPTVGVEYEYRLPYMHKMFGIGAVVERIFADYAATIYVAGVVVHPWKALKLNISAGQEKLPSYTKDVVRVGVGYDFHYGNWSYGPVYNLDRISGKSAHVIGLAVGMGF